MMQNFLKVCSFEETPSFYIHFLEFLEYHKHMTYHEKKTEYVVFSLMLFSLASQVSRENYTMMMGVNFSFHLPLGATKKTN